MHIGFLGLGAMGKPMARNLLGLGHTVTVYNRTPGRTKELAALGALEATTVAEAVAEAEVAITVLSDEAAVAAVVHGPGGLIQSLPPKGIHLCMSTICVEASVQLAAAHARADQGYVAAPIFGRAEATASRHIWFVAGGPEPQVNRCLPIFVALGRGLTRVGPKAALAHALKLGGNVITAALMDALPEILGACEQAGLAASDVLRLLGTEVFKSPLMDALGHVAVPRSSEPPDLSLDLAANEMLTALQNTPGLGVTLREPHRPEVRLKGAGLRSHGWEGPPTPPGRSESFEEKAEAPEAAVPKDPPPLDRRKGGRKPPKLRRKSDVVVPPLPVKHVSHPAPSPPKAPPSPTPPAESPKAHVPPPLDPSTVFTALDGADRVALDLNGTSHFEEIKGQVWAWSRGKRYRTQWASLAEVTVAFHHVLLLLIHRHVLLRPEAVLELRTAFGGRAKARVDGDLELGVSRAAAQRLKVVLGL